MKTTTSVHIIMLQAVLALTCMGMILTGPEEMKSEETADERELALVRREVPTVFVSNVAVDTASVGTSLFDGDTLSTDRNGYAMLLFMDQSVTRVRPESQLTIRGAVNRDRSSSSRIDIERGEIFMDVNPKAGSDVEVGTSNSVASVKGTVFGARSNGYYWVQEGEVDVSAAVSGDIATITGRMYAQVSDDGLTIVTGELTEEELDDLSGQYRVLDSDPVERTLRLRFRDENGELREIELNYYE